MLKIIKDGVTIDRGKKSGKITCIAGSIADIPNKGDFIEDLFGWDDFPYQDWSVNNVIVNMGVFIKLDLIVGDAYAFGVDKQGHALSAWSQEYGAYELQPRQYKSGNVTMLSFNPRFTIKLKDWVDGQPPASIGPWVSWKVTFEAGSAQTGLVGSVSPSLPISTVPVGSLLCVGLSSRQNYEQRTRGVWQTSATFWIAPAGLIWSREKAADGTP